jgi:hypothetical protein
MEQGDEPRSLRGGLISTKRIGDGLECPRVVQDFQVLRGDPFKPGFWSEWQRQPLDKVSPPLVRVFVGSTPISTRPAQPLGLSWAVFGKCSERRRNRFAGYGSQYFEPLPALKLQPGGDGKLRIEGLPGGAYEMRVEIDSAPPGYSLAELKTQ